MPIFFLYFNQKIGLKEVVLLEAIYYIAVVLLEVPSGYFSDYIGRKKTLIISAVALCLACIFYLSATSFVSLILGQICFAGWMAFQSGTTTVFLFESLKEQNIEHEYGQREAQVNKWSMYCSGLAALIGGFLGTYDLKYPYMLTFIFACIALFVSFKFTEPKKAEDEEAEPLMRQLKNTFAYLKIKPLGWMFAYLILMYVLAHIPYEFYQPYLKLLENKAMLADMKAPLVSGVIYAITMFIGAWASGISINLSERIGLKNLMFLSLGLMLAVIAFMGFLLHAAVILIILFRGLPRSLTKAPINALITPKIDAGKRATFHSMISLVGRLSFSLSMLLLSFMVAKNEASNWQAISKIFLFSLTFGLIISAAIILFSKRNKI